MDNELGNASILLLLAGFAVKHGLCDFALQSKAMVTGKARYGHPGGLAHVAIHGLGSLAVLIWLPLAWGLIAALVAIEMLVHYHIDWGKEQIGARLGIGPQDQGFWIAIGMDQTLHQLTYLAMVAWLIT